MTVLIPVLGLWAVRVPVAELAATKALAGHRAGAPERREVAAAIGAVAAMAAGLLIGERDTLVLLCRFAFSGAALGAAFGSVLPRAREIARSADLSTAEDDPPC